MATPLRLIVWFPILPALGLMAACSGNAESPSSKDPAAVPGAPAGAPAEAAAVEAPAAPLPGSWETRSPSPEVAEAMALRGGSNITQARAILDARIQATGEDADAFYVRGRTYMDENTFDAAAADFRTAWGLDPSFQEARLWHAHSLVQQRRCEAALPLFDELLVAWPDDAATWFNRGHCHYYTEQYDKAKVDTTKACELGLERACNTVRKVEWKAKKAAEQAAAGAVDTTPKAKPYAVSSDNTEGTGGPVAPKD